MEAKQATCRSLKHSSGELAIKVLHVTTCFDGGVSRAIESLVRNVPDAEHLLAYAGSDTPSKNFRETVRLDNFVGRSRQIRKFARSANVDVIHAHSSWAGLATRVVRNGAPVVYQPHCYKFDDPEASPLLTRSVRIAEKLLLRRYPSTITLTPHEAQLASGLGVPADAIFTVVNTPSPGISTWDPIANGDTTIPIERIVMIGRLARQKDPLLFLDVYRDARKLGVALPFVWVGDGDLTYKRQLEREGIHVTGWLDTDAVASYLGPSTLYVHSAAYEGFPLSILDAAVAGSPVIAREIAALAHTNLAQFVSAADGARSIHRTLSDPTRLAALKEISLELASAYSPAIQRQQALNAYRKVIDGSP